MRIVLDFAHANPVLVIGGLVLGVAAVVLTLIIFVMPRVTPVLRGG